MRVINHIALVSLLVGLASIAHAQNRKADIALRLLTNVDSLNFIENDTITYDFEVTNNGPDTLKSTDLLWLKVIVAFYVNNPVILKCGKTVPPGEKMEFSHKFKIRGNIKGDSVNSCIRIYKVYSYQDPDTLDRELESQLDDNDSCFTVPYSLATASITSSIRNHKPSIYPNPFTSYLNVYSPVDAEIIIKDSYGRTISTEQITGKNSIALDLSHLRVKGIYYITTLTQNYSYTNRVIKAE